METFRATINAAKARRATIGGRDWLIAPATLIVPGVLNGSKGPLLYIPDEIAASAAAWNGRPLLINHPFIDGQPVSANNPQTLATQEVGKVYNAVAGKTGKLLAEAWFDVESLRRVSPRVLDSLQRGQPVELSTGLFTDEEPAQNGAAFNGRGYTHIARNYRPDHLAVLSDAKGACAIKDGCGVLVNAYEQSLHDKQADLQVQLAEKFGRRFPFGGNPGIPSAGIYVTDIYEDYLVFDDGRGLWRVGYAEGKNGCVLDDEEPVEVRRVTAYEPTGNAGNGNGNREKYDLDHDDLRLGAVAAEELAETGRNPASWVKDEAKWERAKEAARKGGKKTNWAVVTHIYKQMGGTVKKGATANQLVGTYDPNEHPRDAEGQFASSGTTTATAPAGTTATTTTAPATTEPTAAPAPAPAPPPPPPDQEWVDKLAAFDAGAIKAEDFTLTDVIRAKRAGADPAIVDRMMNILAGGTGQVAPSTTAAPATTEPAPAPVPTQPAAVPPMAEPVPTAPAPAPAPAPTTTAIPPPSNWSEENRPTLADITRATRAGASQADIDRMLALAAGGADPSPPAAATAPAPAPAPTPAIAPAPSPTPAPAIPAPPTAALPPGTPSYAPEAVAATIAGISPTITPEQVTARVASYTNKVTSAQTAIGKAEAGVAKSAERATNYQTKAAEYQTKADALQDELDSGVSATTGEPLTEAQRASREARVQRYGERKTRALERSQHYSTTRTQYYRDKASVAQQKLAGYGQVLSAYQARAATAPVPGAAPPAPVPTVSREAAVGANDDGDSDEGEGQQLAAILNADRPGADAYAYVPDKDAPSTWKLRIDDAAHIGGAIAALGGGYRGRKVQIPAVALPVVKKKVRAAWLKAHPDKAEKDVPEVIRNAGTEQEQASERNGENHMAMTQEQRRAAVAEIVANCDCWVGEEGARVLNALPDERLAKVKAGVERVAAMEAVVNAVRAGFGQETTAVKELPALVANAAAGGPAKRPSEAEWLAGIPEGLREQFAEGQRSLSREREAIVGRLVTNIGDEARRKQHAEWLGGKQMDELRALSELLPAVHATQTGSIQPLYLGAAVSDSGIAVNAAENTTDILPLPTMNWEDEEEPRRKAAAR